MEWMNVTKIKSMAINAFPFGTRKIIVVRIYSCICIYIYNICERVCDGEFQGNP